MRTNILKLAIAAFGATAAMSAQADITWGLSSSGDSASKTFSSGGISTTATGWADPTGPYPHDPGGALGLQTLAGYSSGLGMKTLGVADTPDHAVGNGIELSDGSYTDGPNEMVLFSFDTDVTLTDVSVGWSRNDSDISVLAWEGAGTPVLAGGTWAEVGDEDADPTASGWTFIGHYGNVDSGGAGGINAGLVSSSYWLVGALNTQVEDAGSSFGPYPDFVKIASLTGFESPPGPGPGPGPGVPEPATILLLAAGLPLLRAKKGLFARKG